VRVYWDCTFSDSCERTITITNNLDGIDLQKVMLSQAWDFDVTPTERHEELYLHGVPSASHSFSSYSTVDPDFLTWDGRVTHLINGGINDPPCSASNNTNLPWTASTSWWNYCNAGAMSVLTLPDIPPHYSVSVKTRLAVFAASQPFTNWLSQNTDTMFVAAASHFPTGPSPASKVIAVSMKPGDISVPFLVGASTGSVLPGVCPCVGNANCTYDGIRGPCICDERHYGPFCESDCGEHGTWNSDDEVCNCEQGWYGVSDCTPCICKRGSHCDVLYGDCTCKNGLVGHACDKLHTCSTTRQ